MSKEKHATTNSESSPLEDLAGKYLAFALEEEKYGLEILKVQEIIGVVQITSVPNSPEYMIGVINLRGKIIPIVDLRVKLGMVPKKNDEKTCIIVVDINVNGRSTAIGLLVDTVWEVMEFAAEQIELAPEFGSDANSNYILGMGKTGENIIILLDINKTLNDRTLSQFCLEQEEESIDEAELQNTVVAPAA